MKIAIICDWLVVIGGAEKVLKEMLTCFPEADLFAVIDFLPREKRHYILEKEVRTTFIQKLPFAKTIYRQYLPLMTIGIEQLNLSKYDLIISSSHAVAKGVITGPDQLHISYTHSPMRYAWDLQHQYLNEAGLNNNLKGYLARYFLHRLRLWDARSALGVDHFIANSQFIARRIQKTYRREATVIYPPTDLTQFKVESQKSDYYLAASRLVPYKKIDLLVESFKYLPDKKLIVIGQGPDTAKIRQLAGPNVTLLGYQPDATLMAYMQKAKAFLFAAEEDFGIVPVEAQACGTPVIAFGKGGALETVVPLTNPSPTGVFFHEQQPRAVCDAITTFEKNAHYFIPEHCRKNATRFSLENFRQNFKQFILEKCEQFFHT